MFKYVAGAVGLLVAGIVAFAAWSVQAKREEHRAITAIVAEASTGLAATLKQPAPEQAARLEQAIGALHALGTRRQKPYAEAADVYLTSARAIAQRQAVVARFARQAQEAREALHAHVRGPRGRGDFWIRRATELQQRMDRAHSDLARVQDALVELLRTGPDAEKPLAEFYPAIVTDVALYDAALKRAQDERKRAAALAEEARRLH